MNSPSDSYPANPQPGNFTIVAVALWWRGRIGLFKRSSKVSHDQGLWHCITGYLSTGSDARDQALLELREEVGLAADVLERIDRGPILTLRASDGREWIVHTFRAETRQRRLTLDWEHDAFRWVRPDQVSGFTHVTWLADVLAATAGTAAHK